MVEEIHNIYEFPPPSFLVRVRTQNTFFLLCSFPNIQKLNTRRILSYQNDSSELIKKIHTTGTLTRVIEAYNSYFSCLKFKQHGQFFCNVKHFDQRYFSMSFCGIPTLPFSMCLFHLTDQVLSILAYSFSMLARSWTEKQNR